MRNDRQILGDWYKTKKAVKQGGNDGINCS